MHGGSSIDILENIGHPVTILVTAVQNGTTTKRQFEQTLAIDSTPFFGPGLPVIPALLLKWTKGL